MNIDNINRVIEAIRAEPNHFVMRDWTTAPDAGDNFENEDARRTLARNNPCNTVGCIGGWADSLALNDIADGKMQPPESTYGADRLYPTELAAAFFGVSPRSAELDSLFHMDRKFSMAKFDRLPDEKRAEVGARALEIFRDNNGKSDWKRALEEGGVLDKVQLY